MCACFLRRLVRSFGVLGTHPNLGAMRDELWPGLRMRFFHNYVAYYQVTHDAVIIVRVSHGAREQTALFRQD